MANKIFRSIVLVASVVLLCSLGIILGVLYGYFDNVQINQLKDELRLAAVGTEESGLDFLQNVESDRFRLTWVDSDGRVLYDTHAESNEMENHGDREEIRKALRYGTGSASRHSDTMLKRTVYEAKRLSDGTVIRIAQSQLTVMVLLIGTLQPVCLVLLIAIVLSAVLSDRMSRKIVEPLEQLDLENPLENDTYDELSPMLTRIHQQHQQIRSQMNELQQKNDEFHQIISNMREGLILLDSGSRIISINPAAMKIFATDETCIGRKFCELDWHNDLLCAMDAAFRTGEHQVKARRNGCDYKFLFSRIESGEGGSGLELLALDITDIENAERNRREFTANVSHELKTPLQAIIGSTELLQNGLVKQEDVSRFLGNIQKEATRLVQTIQDIIKLSHLESGAQIPEENIDLLLLAQEQAASLEFLAQQREITISVSGEHCIVHGIRSMLCEILQNLCSNAVRYNVDGGKVDIQVHKIKGHTVLTVADTGIGIPREHQSRVFERFYRVDKSHSRETGGTGLGLSIVKHAVNYHNAKIDLQSSPGRGTTFTVTF